MHRIMILEDDDKIADILASYLERYGYEPVRPSSFQDIKSEFLDACPQWIRFSLSTTEATTISPSHSPSMS